jgi:sec-independent protein translocase protein TatB
VFDVSFSELLVIAIVALLVIGPEKLPKVARTLGALTGRLQRYVAQVKEEVNREVRFEELQKLQQEIEQGVQQTEASIKSEATKLKKEVIASPVAKTKAVKKTAVKKSPIKKIKVKS